MIAPNCVHHLFVGEWFAAFPAATIYAAPGLAAKRADLPFHAVLGNEPPAGWAGQIDQHVVGGIPHVNEVAFLHRRSRTLLLTDLAFNVRNEGPLLTRLFMRLNGALHGFGPTRILRSFIRDRRALRASVDHLLTWDFDRITVTHGHVLESGGGEALRAAFAWLRP